MTLCAVPASIWVMVTTTASVALKRRGDHRLQRHHDLAGHRHRVARVVRHRRVAAAPLDDDLQHVRDASKVPVRLPMRRAGHWA
jgi:hypothetical protein